MSSIIKVSNLHKSYDEKNVLERLNLDIPEGSVVGLLGKNGVGKSTLLHSIIGLNTIDKGDISLFGHPNLQLPNAIKERIGFVAQTADEFHWMTVEELLKFKSVFYKKWNQTWVDTFVKKWTLSLKDKVGDLSQGQLQRLSLITAMAHSPDLLILDEPVSALDPAGRRDFLKEVIEITSEGNKTVLFSTHITSDLERVASHIAVLNGGVIQLFDEIDKIKDNTKRLVVDGESANLESLNIPNQLSKKVDGRLVQATVSKLDQNWVAEQKQKGINIKEYSLSLEDIFLEIAQ